MGAARRLPGGGASCLAVGRPGSGALPRPTARPLGRAAGAHHSLAVGAGGAAVETRYLTHSARSCELPLRAVRAARGRPRGARLAWVWVVRGRALSHPPTARPFGRAAGAYYPLAVGAGGAGVGTRHQPHSARSCELALRAVGAARGHPGGAPLALVWVVRRRALSQPRPPGLGGVRLKTATHWLWVRGLRAWGPVTNPTARALASWLGALLGRLEGTREGAPLAWVGSVRCRALSHPRPPVVWGVRPGPTTNWLWLLGVRAWGPAINPTARALASRLCAPSGRHEGARGGCLVPGCGASGVGRSPTTDCPSFGACGRGSLPTGCACGGRGRGDPSPNPQRALLRAGFARCEGGTTAPGGGCLLPECRASGVGRSPSPHRPSFGACGQGPLPNGFGCGGCGRGDPSPTPQRALATWLCALWGRLEGVQEGRLLPGCG